MAAENGQGYLSKVVRSGARPFFASARRAGRTAYSTRASEPSEVFATSDSPIQPDASVNAEPFTTPASPERLETTEREVTNMLGDETARADAADETSTEDQGLDTSAPSDISSTPVDEESEVVIRPAREVPAAVEASAKHQAVVESEAPASPAASLPAGSAEPSKYETRLTPQEKGTPSHAPVPTEGEASHTQVLTPAEGRHASPSSLRQEGSMQHGEPALQREEFEPRRSEGGRVDARAEGQGHQVEAGKRDKDVRRDAEEAAPLLQHTRGETIVRLPRLSGKPGPAPRQEQRPRDITEARSDLEDLRAAVAEASNSSPSASTQTQRLDATRQAEAGGAFGDANLEGTSTPSLMSVGDSSLRPGAESRVNPSSREKSFAPTFETAPPARPSRALESAQNAPSSPAAKRHPSAEAKDFAPGQSSRSGDVSSSSLSPRAASASTAGNAQAYATPRTPAHAVAARADASAAHEPAPAAQTLSPAVHARGVVRSGARETAELQPAESKRPRVGEAKAGRESPSGGVAPKVSVGRLDVRIVNQTPTPPAPAPAPTPPAPSPKRDGWESLDRGHMGRLFLL